MLPIIAQALSPGGIVRRSILLAFALVAAFAPATFASVDIAPDAVPPADPAVVQGTLANGMRYFIRRNEKPEHRVELRLAIKVGSVQESEAERGLAHFIEHMNFNGSENFKAGELIPWLESIGMRFGADTNAYTSYDETVYMLQIPTDKPGALDKGLMVMADWTMRATLAGVEIDKERGVVLDELRRGKGAGRRIRDKQDQLLFQGSRYADRLPIGLESVITGATHETVRGFHARWYRPDTMAIIVVGDLDEKAMETRVREVFGALPAPEQPTVIPEWPVPSHDETLISVESDAELTSSAVQIIWKHDAEPTRTVGDARRDAVRQIAAGLLSARLAERAQKSDPPFLGAFAGVGNRVQTLMTFSLFARAKDGQLPVAASALMEELARAREHGFVEAELDRVKTSALAGAETRFRESSQRRSDERVGSMVQAFLDDEVLTSDQYDFEIAKALLPGITLADVNGAIRQLTDTASRVVLAQAPAKPGAVPSREQLEAALAPAGGFAVEAYVDDLAGMKLVDFEPEPGPVTGKRAHDAVGATEYVLSNGLRVVIKPTDFRADQVLMRGFAMDGAAALGPGRLDAAIRADTLAGDSGLGEFTATQLGKFLQAEGVIASAGPGVSLFSRTFGGSARPQDVETMLQLVHLYFMRPAFREDAFRRMVEAETQSLKNQLNSPGGVFGRAVQEALYRGHWMFRPDTIEGVQSLRREAIEAAYREMFSDASEWTFVLVGNVDVATHLPLIEKWLGSLPTTSAAPRKVVRGSWMDLGLKFPPGKSSRRVSKGIEDQSRTFFTWPVDTGLDPQAEFDLDAATDLLQIKLRERLREELGETYGVGVSYSTLNPSPEFSRVVVSWTSAPGPRESMVQVLRDTIRFLRMTTPSEADTSKLREMRSSSLARARMENGYWLGSLVRSFQRGEDPRLILEQENRIQRLTSKTLRTAIRRWLDPSTSLEVFLMPENWNQVAATRQPAEAPVATAAQP